MLLNLLNQYTVEKSTDQNQSQLINMYLEEEQTTRLSQYPYAAQADPPKGEYKVIAYPTFGLSTFCTTGQSVIRDLFEHNEVLYCVAGNKFGSINSGGTFTQIGSNLSTSTGYAKIVAITGGSDTNNQLIIIDGTNGYHYNVTTTTATFPITDVDFPQTCTAITTQDDYVIVEKANSISFYLSNVSDGTSWAALDFASKFRKPDRIMSVLSLKGELWLLGTKTCEVWNNTGQASFPFERRTDVFLEVGCAAKNSVFICGSTMIFLAKTRAGGYSIIAIDNYTPKNIATKAIMELLGGMTDPTDCIGYSYAKDGHEFACFNFVTDNKTMVYDVTNETWTVRQSLVSGTQGRFLGQCHAFCYGKSLVGDFNSGLVYSQERAIYTDNGVAVQRRFVSPPVYQEGKRLYISRLQIDVQTNVGSNKTFTLEVSTDRGATWSTIDTYTVPTSGDGTIYTTSLGSAFCFLFRITTTDNFNFILLGFQCEVTAGEH